MSRARATYIGFSAVLLWSLLALFTVGTTPMPAFQLSAISFSIGGAVGVVWAARNGGMGLLKSVPLQVYAFGTAGLFGYHYLYFSALRAAPAAEAGLIAYLWPLLIVLFSGFLPGEKLRLGHIIGAIISFGGAAIIILGGDAGFSPEFARGYAYAAGCALVWAGYSVLSRRLGSVPTQSVAIFCVATAILSLAAHLITEETVWPASNIGWVSVILLGLGPVGLAFYVWDIGVKQGDIQLLGTASYAAPLMSTLILITAGIATPRWSLVLAAVLITGGALFAARASTKKDRNR